MMKREPVASNQQSPTRFLVLPLWILAIFAMGMLMQEAATIFLWVVCAFFLFVLLDPMAQKLKSIRVPTALTAVLLVLSATIVGLGIVYLFGYLFSGMVVELEQSKKLFLDLINNANNSLHTWSAKIPGLHPMSQQAGEHIQKVEVVQASPLGGELGGTILHGLGSAVTVLTFALLVPILSFFLLAERDVLARTLSLAYLNPATATRAWNRIVGATRSFFIGNLILGIITYPVFILLFWAFSVPSIFTVAALATFFNLIPFAGAVLAGFLPAVALYTQTQSIGGALGVYGLCVAIHFVVADFITPKILGSQVNINATTSTIALVAWGEIWGGVGLILAIPLTAFIKILFENSNMFWLEWLAALMSERADEAIEPEKILAPEAVAKRESRQGVSKTEEQTDDGHPSLA